jgi:hypothetical protein
MRKVRVPAKVRNPIGGSKAPYYERLKLIAGYRSYSATGPIYRVELVRERGIPTAQPQFRSSADVARLLHAVLAGVDSGALSTGM